MNSQGEQSVILSELQLESIRLLTCSRDSDIKLDTFTQLVQRCAQIRLSLQHVRDIDLSFSAYRNCVLQSVTAEFEICSIETIPDLLRALFAYHELIVSGNAELSSINLCDIMGYVVLSIHALEKVIWYVKQSTMKQTAHPPEKLKSLWKSATELTLKLVGLLEKYQHCDQSELLPTLSGILETLANIGRAIADVETKTMILIYKCVLRLITKNVSHYTEDKVLERVTECISHSLHHNLTQYTAVQNMAAVVKVLVFLIRLIAKLLSLDTTGSVVSSDTIIEVILSISIRLCNAVYGYGVDVGLESALKSLLSSCLKYAAFSSTFLPAVSQTENKLSGLYSICLVLECLASSGGDNTHWLSDDSLRSIISALASCGNEICCPLSHNSSSGNQVTTGYEFTLSRLCSVIATTPAGHLFKQVEKLLFSMLLSQYVHLNLMAVDCWHFVARYSPDRLPLSHSLSLLDLQNTGRLTEKQQQSIQCMLSRLIPLLSVQQQQRVVSHPSAFDSGVLSKSWFEQNLHTDIELLITQSIQRHVTKLESDEANQNQRGVLFYMKATIRLLNTKFNENSSQTEEIITEASTLIADILTDNIDNPGIYNCLCLALQSFTSRRYHTQLLRVLHSLTGRFDQIDLGVQRCMIESLSCLTTLPSTQDKELVVSLCSKGISSSHVILKLISLESFRRFAKVTPYQELINHIANQSDQINKSIVRYCKGVELSDMAARWSADEDRSIRWNMSTIVRHTQTDTVTDQHSHIISAYQTNEEPVDKRPRLNADTTLDELEGMIASLHSQTGSLTSYHISRLENLQDKISHIISANANR